MGSSFGRLESWDFEEDLDAADQLVQPLRSANAQAQPMFRIDPPHTEAESPAPVQQGVSVGWLSWAILATGVMTTVCGAGLLIWAIVDQRPELLTIGAPCSLAGQAVLILGLLMQLESLWRETQGLRQSLAKSEQQFHDLSKRLAAVPAPTKLTNLDPAATLPDFTEIEHDVV